MELTKLTCDYAAREIRKLHKKITESGDSSSAGEAGAILCQIEQILDPRDFSRWLRSACDISEDAAQRYIQARQSHEPLPVAAGGIA